MRKKIITLTTDFGLRDGFVGVMHGVILRQAPEAEIVDLTHEIPAHDIRAAAFLLESHSPFFPPESIHVAVVDPGVGSGRAILLAEYDSHFFLAPDNGLLSFLRHRADAKFYHAKNKKIWLPLISQTFHGRDIFAPLAAQLAIEQNPGEAFGPITAEDIVTIPDQYPSKTANSVAGEFIYCDRFGNLITNIRKADVPADKKLSISVGHNKLDKIANAYSESPPGDLLAIFNSFNRLEIAINQGRANDLFPMYKHEKITISW
ncbi:MAG: hypothetical protein DWQ10_14820 [Calditrichaeota bacterium]|nr:MAG: hypothetical protein DWQ10_14820 [Calditrichota bacterium]